jgi:non-heme chloroperoxidase
MRFQRVQSEDGQMIHIDVQGNAARQSLVFLHGGWETPYCFHAQDALADRYFLVKPHLRGHGLSGQPQELAAYHSRLFAADLHGVISHLSLQRPVVVVNSYAGLVVFDYLARYGPDGLGGIVFACAIPPDLGAETSGRYFTPAVLELMPQFLSGEDEAVIRFVDLLTAAPLPAGTVYAEILKDNLRTPPAVRAHILKREGPPLLVDAAGTLPVLIIQGEQDRGLQARPCVAAFQTLLPQARVSWFPESGHFPFLEEPALFNETLTRFVERKGIAS